MGMAVIEGTREAVDLVLVLIGMMCLWSGIMYVLKASGVLSIITKLLTPILRFIYPDAYQKRNGIDEIAMSITANFFGLGNASTVISLKAMDELNKNNNYSYVASKDMISFTVLNTCAVNLMPTTLISLRYASGSTDPFEILFPVWVVSILCYIFAVILLKMFGSFYKG